MPRVVPARFVLVVLVVTLLLVPLAGCQFGAETGPSTTGDSYTVPDPPETLTVDAAREVAARAEAAHVAQTLSDRSDVSTFSLASGPGASHARGAKVGDVVYVRVAYPYTYSGPTRTEAVSRGTYLVTTDRVERIRATTTVDADPFDGGRTVDDPVDLRLADASADPATIRTAITYLDAPATAYTGTATVAGGAGRTVEDVASRVGTYRVTASVGGETDSVTVRVGPDDTAPIVVVVTPAGHLGVVRVGTPA